MFAGTLLSETDPLELTMKCYLLVITGRKWALLLVSRGSSSSPSTDHSSPHQMGTANAPSQSARSQLPAVIHDHLGIQAALERLWESQRS